MEFPSDAYFRREIAALELAWKTPTAEETRAWDIHQSLFPLRGKGLRPKEVFTTKRVDDFPNLNVRFALSSRQDVRWLAEAIDRPSFTLGLIETLTAVGPDQLGPNDHHEMYELLCDLRALLEESESSSEDQGPPPLVADD